jgi:hypothetical protein
MRFVQSKADTTSAVVKGAEDMAEVGGVVVVVVVVV